MEPRLPTSRKWTSLPKEYLEQITQVFTENFTPHLQGGQIQAQGRIYTKELLLRVSYWPLSSTQQIHLKQANFEASIEYDKNKDNMIQLISNAIDATGSMVEAYFTQRKDIQLPLFWQPTNLEGREVFLQYSTVNTQLENLADQILGQEESDQLVQGEDDVEELDIIKSKLGLDTNN